MCRTWKAEHLLTCYYWSFLLHAGFLSGHLDQHTHTVMLCIKWWLSEGWLIPRLYGDKCEWVRLAFNCLPSMEFGTNLHSEKYECIIDVFLLLCLFWFFFLLLTIFPAIYFCVSTTFPLLHFYLIKHSLQAYSKGLRMSTTLKSDNCWWFRSLGSVYTNSKRKPQRKTTIYRLFWTVQEGSRIEMTRE